MVDTVMIKLPDVLPENTNIEIFWFYSIYTVLRNEGIPPNTVNGPIWNASFWNNCRWFCGGVYFMGQVKPYVSCRLVVENGSCANVPFGSRNKRVVARHVWVYLPHLTLCILWCDYCWWSNIMQPQFKYVQKGIPLKKCSH